MKLSVSLLSAPLLSLASVVEHMSEAGVDRIHLDIMDGRYVRRIAFGLDWVHALHCFCVLPVDVHFMVTPMDTHRLQDARDLGADRLWVHPRTCAGSIDHTQWVSSLDEPVSELPEIITHCLMMSVSPGAGGQAFDERVYERIQQLKRMHPDVWIAVDGGVQLKHVPLLSDLGVNEIIMGQALVNAQNVADCVAYVHQF